MANSKKCIVPDCENLTGGSVRFFGVPPAGSKFFGKWQQFMKLSGSGAEMICEVHFGSSNYIKRMRRILKKTAVPQSGSLKVLLKVNSCCVVGCRTRSKKTLVPFPSVARKRQLKLWKASLNMAPHDSIAGLRICYRHFEERDFETEWCQFTSSQMRFHVAK